MRHAFAILAALGLSAGCDQAPAPTAEANAAPASQASKPVTLDTLLAEPGVVLLDVRTEGEWKATHIKGAKHLPLSQIDKIAEIVPDKSTPIVAHCLSGGRSGRATDILRRKGYTRVVNGGGFKALATKAQRALE